MAVVHTTQRNAFTVNEDGDLDALPSRLYRTLARNGNNLRSFVVAPMMVLQRWAPTLLAGPTLGATAETYLAQWPGLIKPNGRWDFRFAVGAVQTAGNGTGAQVVTATLRAYRETYVGAGSGGGSVEASVTINQGSGNGHRFFEGRIIGYNANEEADTPPEVHFALFATNGDVNSTANFYSLRVWCIPEGL